LGSHRVRDGEVLHLVPGRQAWPELDYDDLVDAIATGSRRRTRTWEQRHTRGFGLAAGGVAMSLAMFSVFRSGPDWALASRWALTLAAMLVLAAVVLARSIGDSGAGTMVGLLSLPYAFVGGALLVAQPGRVLALTAPQLEVASATVLLFALLGYLGVGDDGAPFVGAAVAALLGILGGWLTSTEGISPPRSATIVVSIALLASPLFSSLAITIGRLPMPTLPRTPADLLRDEPQPPRAAVYAAVARADGLFTGLLMGTCAAAAICAPVLALSNAGHSSLLVVVVTAGFVLRARLYPIVRQRLPFLLTALVGVVSLLLGPATHDRHLRLIATGPGLLALGAAAILVGLAYSRRIPGPYLRRYTEIFEVLVILAVLPVGAAVLGLYGRLRGLG
jgi:type VII secretion integral membrane protein EccD